MKRQIFAKSLSLLNLLTEPARLTDLDLSEWDRLLPRARRAGVLGRLHSQLARQGGLSAIPAPAKPHLEAGAIIAEEHARKIRWEVNRIQRALSDVSSPIVLLKGAAYLLAGLPCAEGRLVADVDILTPREHLPRVEQALLRHGWETVDLDDYDQSYYRRWMHELPPLRHRLRGVVVDVHHTILPVTSRLKPDPAKLFAQAQPLPGTRFLLPAPTDMVLHSAAHAFYDGDLSNPLRDLLDLHELLLHFGAAPMFWQTLPQRAQELDLARPLYYALRYARRFMGTPIPPAAFAALEPAGPKAPTRRLMDALLDRSVAAGEQRSANAGALWLLYLRSHWLRMPPWLLTGHLLRKAGKRLRGRWPQPNQAGG